MSQSTQKEGEGGGHPQYLEPSELGTKEYWETFYTRSLEHIASKKRGDPHLDAEKRSIQENHDDESEEEEEEADGDDDPGTSWFSEHDAPLKVLKFLSSRKFPLSPRRRQQQQQQQQQQQPSILDLGTGNGSMLAMLRKRGGFMGQMVGVDYSAQSVQLARELQRLKLHSAYASDDDDESGEESEEGSGEEEHEDIVAANNTGSAEAIPVNEQDIRFEEWDILDPTNEDALSLPPPVDNDDEEEEEKRRIAWFPYRQAGFDIVLDKGTFDAVSLSDETITTNNDNDTTEKTTKAGKTVQPRICHKYPRMAARLVRPGGFLVVTSCNWTEEELVQWFTAPGELSVWGRVEYPRFRFGGHEGQGVCTVCFRRGVS